jgi:tetraacyldisaccharide 4'-kinase
VPRIDEAAFLRLIRGQSRGVGAASARLGLSLTSIVYGAAVRVRNATYDLNWKTIERAPVPVISVGNLTLGGTGKTPMVEWIARWFRERYRRVAILSRGYGQTEGMNDEGRVLEENLPDVPHLQGRDRAKLAHTAVEELESEVLVLDDGFQHRRLARDLDVVLLDAFDPFGQGRIFPRGLLRESPRSLRRAGVVVLSRADVIDQPQRADVRRRAERWAGREVAWVEARHAPRDLIDSAGNTGSIDDFRHRAVAAFCGIGNPKAFETTLAGLGLAAVAFRAFPDHHAYTSSDVADLAAWARNAGADLILTTQKDLVKLRVQSLGSAPLQALRIGLELLDGQPVLEAALTRILASLPAD